MNKTNASEVTVIGAGAAGMMAALQAAWRGAQVTLVDANPNPGRKLLVTGAGRCNLTNANIAAERYACSDPAWLTRLFQQFGRDDLLMTLEKIGVLAVPTWDGWYYPRSESAATVVDAFTAALHAAGVRMEMNTRILHLKKSGQRFVFAGDDQRTFASDRVVLAAGGMAYPTLGSRGECLPLLEQLGHTILPMRPALAPLLADMKSLHALQGVRLDVQASLWQGRNKIDETSGNLIVTQWGFNGPAVMDLSHHVSARPAENLVLELNLLPGESAVSLRALLARKKDEPVALRVLLGSVLPPRVATFILQQARLEEDVSMNQLTQTRINNVLERLEHLRVNVKGVRGFEYCQVAAGGVVLKEVNPGTMQSHVIPGLFLAGEILDVTGPCGGFNLQFAFSSGAVAGDNSAR